MPREKVTDLDHYIEEGSVTGVRMEDTSWVSYRSVGVERDQVPVRSFAMGQLLKFGDLKKSVAKSMEPQEIVREVGSRSVVFKRTEDEILAVVSPDFQDVNTNYIHHSINQAWNQMGIEVDSVSVEKGLVTRVWYQLQEDTVTGLSPGVHLRNSVFGASALGMNRFYVIDDIGARFMLHDNDFSKYHIGGMDQIREQVSEAATTLVRNMWSDLGKVQEARQHSMGVDAQMSVVREKQENRKITKEMADEIVNHIKEDTWAQEENVWGLIRTLSGYATFGELSAQNRKKVERVAESVLNSETRTRVEA